MEGDRFDADRYRARVLVGAGCAAQTDEPPLAGDDGADENTGEVAQAFNSDFCATGATANDTEKGADPPRRREFV